MGTRADFYVGRGIDAEWLGSTAWDGYPDAKYIEALFGAMTEDEWREKVRRMLESRDDASIAGIHGWPWPWDHSGTTDYAYTFETGVVLFSRCGSKWWRTDQVKESCDDENDAKEAVFPDMSERRELAMGTARDSIMLFGFTSK